VCWTVSGEATVVSGGAEVVSGEAKVCREQIGPIASADAMRRCRADHAKFGWRVVTHASTSIANRCTVATKPRAKRRSVPSSAKALIRQQDGPKWSFSCRVLAPCRPMPTRLLNRSSKIPVNG
jgi:hypothetical protein